MSGSPSRADRGGLALAALPPDDPLVLAEHRRLVEAIEQIHCSARLLGLDPTVGYAPLAIRVDAWLHRTCVERAAWRRVMRSPLIAAREALWSVA